MKTIKTVAQVTALQEQLKQGSLDSRMSEAIRCYGILTRMGPPKGVSIKSLNKVLDELEIELSEAAKELRSAVETAVEE